MKRRSILCETVAFTLATAFISHPARAQFPGAGYYEHALEHRHNYSIRCEDKHAPIEERIKQCKEAVSTLGMSGLDDDDAVLVSLYRIKGDFDSALAEENKSLGHFDSSTDSKTGMNSARGYILQARSVTYAEMGRYDDSLNDANEALRINTDEAAAYNNRCWVRAIAGRELILALADCNKSIDLHNDRPNAYDSRALINFKQGDFKRAIADYDAALKQNARMATSLFGRGVAKQKLGDIQGGEEDITSAKALDASIDAEMAKYGVKS